MPRVLKLTLAYDGTAYVGWQRQANGPSIQGLLEDALSRIDGAPVAVAGAGRTDAGVHALGQVASAWVSSAMGAATFKRALNAILPRDIRVVRVEDVPRDFHARFSAIGKQYDYWIWQGDVQPPFLRCSSWHIPRVLDVAAMDGAAQALVGRHDFAAFQSSRSHVKTSVRTVTQARVLPGDDTWRGASLGAEASTTLEGRSRALGGIRPASGAIPSSSGWKPTASSATWCAPSWVRWSKSARVVGGKTPSSRCSIPGTGPRREPRPRPVVSCWFA